MNGLHQFLEVKSGLRPTKDRMLGTHMSHITFFNRYQEIFGLSGTVGSDSERRELNQLYKVDSFDVPVHVQGKLTRHDPIITPSTGFFYLFQNVIFIWFLAQEFGFKRLQKKQIKKLTKAEMSWSCSKPFKTPSNLLRKVSWNSTCWTVFNKNQQTKSLPKPGKNMSSQLPLILLVEVLLRIRIIKRVWMIEYSLNGIEWSQYWIELNNMKSNAKY